MWSTRELIVAPATAAGPGGRGVVRFSGEGLEPLLHGLFTTVGTGFATAGGPPRLIAAALSPAGLGAEWGLVPVGILHWPGPQGPTGGPLAEVHLPASAALLQAVVTEACRLGARLARGGEFSLRSFLAGRIDLVQAEAVLAVVDATTGDELASALDRLAGGVGRELQGLRESLLDLAADVEASIDFADERTPDAVPAADEAARWAVGRRLAAAADAVDRLARRLVVRDASAGAGLPRVVLVGRPNVGKSSLFNALVGRPAAIVADESGTTRDWIAARVDGGAAPGFLLVDLAGIDPAVAGEGGDADPTADGLRHEPPALAAMERAREEILRADVLVVCRDATGERPPEVTGAAARDVPRLAVATRCDLAASDEPASRCDLAAPDEPASRCDLAAPDEPASRCDLAAPDEPVTGRPPAAGERRTSARTGAGVAALRAEIARVVASLPATGSPATLRLAAGLEAARAAIVAARDAAEDGRAAVDEAVLAGLVRESVAALGEVTGSDLGVGAGTELLDRIFSRHCIGK